MKIYSTLLSLIAMNLTITCVNAADTNFTGYFPPNCTLNNAAAKIKGTCECIKDTNGNIWLAKSNQDPEQTSTFEKIDTWISNLKVCGLESGWKLPTRDQLLPIIDLAKTKVTLGKDVATWFNNNGFDLATSEQNNSGRIYYWVEDPTGANNSYMQLNSILLYSISKDAPQILIGNTHGLAVHASPETTQNNSMR